MQTHIQTPIHIAPNLGDYYYPEDYSTTGNSLIFDRYANSVMRSCLSKLIGVEVRGIRDTEDDQADCSFDDTHPLIFSVFVTARDGGGERVGDFSSYADARYFASELGMEYYLPVHDAIQVQYERYAKFHFVEYRADDLVDAYPLSNGRTVFRRLAPNGSKVVFMMDRNTLSEAEFEEFHRLLRRSSAGLN